MKLDKQTEQKILSLLASDSTAIQKKVHAARTAKGNAKRSKYKNIITVVDGRRFDSKKEANRYIELKAEHAAGIITGLELQVRFPLVVNGELIAKYVADFVYHRGGVQVVEDVKGKLTDVYKLKAKLMKACHGITIHET